MSYDNGVIDTINHLMEQIGLTVPEYIALSGRQKTKLLNFSEETQKEYAELFERIDSNCCSKEEKGKLLEDLMYTLFHKGYSSLLTCVKNCRTSTNEIDLKISWTEEANIQGFPRAFECFNSSFLCECKNYNKKVDVTYVGKFFSLLSVTKTKLGIMIAWNGISGRGNWSDAKGLIKKIALKDDTYIIPIERNDLYRIYTGETNVFSLVNEKYLSIKADIDYEQHIVPHEAQQKMLER